MNTSNENTYTPAVDSAVALGKERKTSWYSTLKENPEALAKFKEVWTQKYEERKNAIREMSVFIGKECPPIIDPERRKLYNTRYYNSHKDKIHDYFRKYYNEEIKGCPERLARERERIKLCQRRRAAKKKQEAANGYKE